MQQTGEAIGARSDYTAAARANQRTRSTARIVRVSRENVVLFAGFLGIYTWAAYYLTIVLGAHHNDTVARTALSYFVLYGREPHLGSIGFVWTPLISVLQLPLLPLLRWFDATVLAGPLLGAVFGAATLPVFNVLSKDLGLSRAVRLPVIVLYALHPTIMLYAAAGMSETVFFFFMTLTTHALMRWTMVPAKRSALVVAGTATALAFWTRYEALPMMVAMGGVVLVVLFTRHRHAWLQFRTSLEAALLIVLTPILFSIALWTVFNWMIMREPLFWLSGAYSNTTFTQTFRSEANPLFHDLAASASYALTRVQLQFVLFPLLVGLVVAVSLWRRSLLPAIPAFIPVTLLVFHVYQSYTGASYGWYRFFTYIVPGAIPMFFWLLTFLPRVRVWRTLLTSTMSAGLAASMVLTVYGMSNPVTGPEEYGFMRAITSGGTAALEETRSFASAKAVAAYLDQYAIEGPILIDSFLGYPVVLFAKQPQQFVKTQDADFLEVVQDPPGHGVQWILVPNPESKLGPEEVILATYPTILEDGVPWAQRVADFGYWQLFRVSANGQQP